MRRLPSIILAAAFAAAAPSASWAQSATATAVTGKSTDARLASGEIEIRAKVVELDMARRLASLKGPKGNIVTLEVPPEVKNFDQVRVGDDLVVRYVAAVVAQLEPASKSGIRERVESTTTATAAAGDKPAVGARRTVEVLAVIQSLDRKARTATLRGAKRTVTVELPESIDVSKLKKGDEVRALIIEALVVNVEMARQK